MKWAAVHSALLLLLAAPALAQTTAAPATPSPTESFGCVAHEDHWHCEGRRTDAPAQATATGAAHDEHDEHDHAAEAPTKTNAAPELAPSPTESIGCHSHGDHWHCSGPNPEVPPSGRGECKWHETHWDCEKPDPNAAGASGDAAHEAGVDESGPCIIHGE